MGTKQIAVKAINLHQVSDSITRPGDTTTYAAHDVVSEVTSNDHFTFAPVLKEDRIQTGEIIACKATISELVATGPDLELWLFDRDIAEVADNGAAAITDTEMTYLVGIITIPTANWKRPSAGNNVQFIEDLNIPFKTLDSTHTLYGQYVIRNAYVPVASEVHTVTLYIRQD